MRDLNELEETSRNRTAKPREAVAIVSLDIEANSLRELIEGIGRAGFKLKIVRALAWARQKPDLTVDLVVLFGEFAKPDNCRTLRDYKFEGYILLLCPKEKSLLREYFEAGADDLVQNWTGAESIYLRGLVAIKHLESRQDAQTHLTKEIDVRRKLELILDTQPELIERFERNGTLTYVNGALCRFLGKSREELIGQNLYAFLPPDLANELIPKLEQCFQSAVPFWNENIVVELNGSIRWVEWHNTPILDMNGQVYEIQASGRDIHEKKVLLEKLRTNEQHLHMALAASNTIIWRWVAATGAIESSENAESIIGFIPQSIQECINSICKEDQTKVLNFFQLDSLKKGEQTIRFRVMHPKSGLVKIIETRCAAFNGMDGEVQGLCGICFDATDRALIEEQHSALRSQLEELVEVRTTELANAYQHLDVSERFSAMGMIAARIAHELNGPIAGIRNAFYLIRGDFEPNNKRIDYLIMVEKELDRLAEILAQLYTLYGPQGRVRSEIDLKTILEESRKMMDVIFSRIGVPIEINVPDNLALIKLPPSLLRQVLYNVLINAVKATPKGMPVTIHATQKNSALEISIHNMGEPISPEVQKTLFEPFSANVREGFSPGLGLGLYISKCLMTEMGGTISIESLGGKGTTVTLSFEQVMSEVEK